MSTRIELKLAEAKRINASYQRRGESLNSTAEKFAISVPIVKRAIRQAGGELRKPGQRD